MKLHANLVPLTQYVFFQEGPGLRKWQWTESGMKVINVTNILPDGSVDVTNTDRYISLNEFQRKYSHFAVEDRDIVVASSGNTYGKVGRINRSHLPIMMNTSVIRFHAADCQQLDDDYLYAFLRSPHFRDQVEQFVIGSAQPNFGPAHLKLMKMPLPELRVQRKIAAILSAYDDLIENNTRRIKILEEMVQSLYREWFVRFRFPGCESVKMVKSAVGIVPEGWKTTSLGDVAEVNAASVKRGQEPEEISYVDIASVNVGQIEKIEQMPFASAPGRARRVVTHGDTIWSCVRPNRRSYALIINPVPNLIVSTGFAVITPKLAPYSYVYYATTTNDFVTYLSNRATGAAYPAVTADGFKNATILLPPQDVLESFHETVVPAHDLIQNLRQKNANLLRTRDLLLPKLVSGEVDVENMQVQIRGVVHE